MFGMNPSQPPPPPDPEQEELAKARLDMLEAMRAVFDGMKPADMNTQKCLDRILMVAMLQGVSRTSVLGVAGYIGLHAQIVGLSEDQVLGVVKAAMKIAADNKLTSKMAMKFAEANQMYHATKNIPTASDAPPATPTETSDMLDVLDSLFKDNNGPTH